MLPDVTRERRLYLILLTEVDPEHLGVALRPFNAVKSRSGGDGLLGAAVLNREKHQGSGETAPPLTHLLPETHGDVAVRLDLIDPEAFLHQGSRPAQQLFELAEGERPHLHQSHTASATASRQQAADGERLSPGY